MLFILISLVFLIGWVVLFKKVGMKYSISMGVAIAISLSIIVNISLAQNYTQSLIPKVNDGIAISNNLAYMIIGEDGWTHELFEATFNYSIYLSLLMILIFPFVIIVEKRLSRK